jgi:hypothetical protein
MVSCSSCPAWAHLLSLDVTQKIRAPNSNINFRNLGTNQRALAASHRRGCAIETRATNIARDILLFW